MSNISNKKQNYNKFSDEQQAQATYDYPKINEAEINNQNNQIGSSARVGETYNDFPRPQSYSYNQESASNIPRNSPPQSYLSNNQQQMQYPMPNNYQYPMPNSNSMAQPQVLIYQQNRPINPNNYENQVDREMEIGNRNPIDMICPFCRRQIQTFVKHKSGLGTNFVALILCFAAGSFCLCFLPYLINRCKDAVHYCPLCNERVGTSSFLC